MATIKKVTISDPTNRGGWYALNFGSDPEGEPMVCEDCLRPNQIATYNFPSGLEVDLEAMVVRKDNNLSISVEEM